MKCRLFQQWLQSLALCGLTASAAWSAEATPAFPRTPAPAPSRWALVVAGGQSDQQPSANHHSHGSRELAERLEKAGFSKSQIVVLSAEQSAADRTPTAANLRAQLEHIRDAARADDVILVCVSSCARTIDGTDYLCTQETEPKALAAPAADVKTRSAVSVAEILKTLKGSASKCRVLVVDSAESGKRDGEQTLGQRTMEMPEGQWAFFNSSHRLRTEPKDAAPTTWFMQSLLDGLAVHADSNVDGQVSLFELTEYMQLYAEARQCAAPTVHGKTTQDFALSEVTVDSQDVLALSPELRDRLAQSLVDSANVSLFVEQNPQPALQALQRAAQYRPSEKLGSEIRVLTNTALTGIGEVAQAWKRADSKSEVLLLRVNTPIELCQSGQKAGKRLPVGLYLKVVSEAASATQNWLYVTAAYEAKYENRRVSFVEYRIEPGMIQLREASLLPNPATGLNLAPTDRVNANLKSLLSRAK